MQKIRYEVDPHNRLTVRGPGRFRQVVDGEFKLADGNVLVYHVKKSDNVDTPQQIKFSGDWELGKNHELALTLDKWNNQAEGNKLVLKSSLIDAQSNELLFSVETRESASRRHINILRFTGSWQADAYNRLTFYVEKRPGSADALVLQGRWEVNKQNEVIYAYPENSITLRGYWQITGKNKLTYVLSRYLGSQLDLTVGFQRAQKDSLQYGVSIGYGERKRVVTLFGRWKIAKGAGLSFELKYNRGDVKVEAELFKSFLNGMGEGYVRTIFSEKEVAVLCGMGFRW